MGDRIVVVGDVMNDIVVVPRGPLRADTDTDARIQPRPGGSAANTAAWLGSLDAPVDFVGSAGAAEYPWHVDVLRQSGVEPHVQAVPGVPTGTIVIVVEGQSRSMMTDRGANAVLDADQLTPELLDTARHVHVSGYSITKDNARRAPHRMIERARAHGIPVSIDPASSGYVADYGVENFLADMAGVDLVFPNLAEGRLLSGEEEPERVGAALLERFPLVVLKLGADGAMLFRRDADPVAVAAPRVEKFIDPTGAGDAFAAGFLASWVRDGDPEAATRQAVNVAARAVMLVGGRPPV